MKSLLTYFFLFAVGCALALTAEISPQSTQSAQSPEGVTNGLNTGVVRIAGETHEVYVPAPGSPTHQPSEMLDTAVGVGTQLATPWIVRFAQEWPWLCTLLAIMGFLRFIFKPLCAALHAYVLSTPDAEDDAIYHRVMQSAWLRWAVVLLDWLGSIKVVPPARGQRSEVSGQRSGPTMPGGIALLLAATIALPALTGCARLAADGVYSGDKALYAAERATVGAYDAMHAFVNWEYKNRALLAEHPEITKAADDVRLNAQRWLDQVIVLRDVYKSSPSPENRTRMQLAVATLRGALEAAAVYMATPLESRKPETK
jgi:hypothetical protein